MIEVRSVTMNYGALRVLADLDLSVQAGEFVAVVGPSGCGKSTFLKLVSGLLKPQNGDIRIDGDSPSSKPAGYFGFAFQRPVLLPWRTISQNITLPRQLLRTETDDGAAAQILTHVGLSGFGSFYPLELSGGMQQRAALGRLLAHAPRLWLLDEPFASLDEITRLHLSLELLHLWRSANATVLFVTHNVEEAVLLANRILVFSMRPSKVVGTLPVDITDRNEQTLYSAPFLETAKCVRSLLAA